ILALAGTHWIHASQPRSGWPLPRLPHVRPDHLSGAKEAAGRHRARVGQSPVADPDRCAHTAALDSERDMAVIRILNLMARTFTPASSIVALGKKDHPHTHAQLLRPGGRTRPVKGEGLIDCQRKGARTMTNDSMNRFEQEHLKRWWETTRHYLHADMGSLPG